LKDRGIGVLITDHNVRETLDIVDRAYILHEGMVLMEGAPRRSSRTRTCGASISASASASSGRAMALSQRLDLRQTQALVMTPQLQQAIKLLQLSNLELSLYVESELEQNPLLEREEAERDGPEPEPTRDLVPDDAPARDSVDLVSAETMPSDNDSPLDAPGAAEPADDGTDMGFTRPASVSRA